MPSPAQDSRRRAAVGLLTASILHAGIFALFALSVDGEQAAEPRQVGGDSAISVGLTRSSAMTDPEIPLATLSEEVRRNQVSLPGQPPPTSTANPSSLFAQMDAAEPSQAAAAGRAEHSAVSEPSAQRGPKLTDASSPWSSASLAAIDGSKARQLWQAAQRCWHGGVSFTPSEIRISLDRAGTVTSMAWIGGGDASARTQAEAVAAAITACAPYRAVAPSAGTYLVVGPMA